jgi:protein-tyrosine kinase
MSVEPSGPNTEISDQDVHDALVSLFGLPKEAMQSILESTRGSLHLRFADAALHTGLITQEQLDEATDWIRRRPIRENTEITQENEILTEKTVGIIEEVLRRQVSQSRELVLWEGPKLKPSDQLIVAHDPHHPHSESIRSLRTELLMRTRNVGGGLIALLSPCPAEGRSQLAAELAIAFAQLGRRTLLVDADLRRPHQHVLFGAENDAGLAQALDNKEVRLHGIGGLPQMALLTSGVLPPNPLELLSGIRFEQLTVAWRRSFEFVILDTPPAVGSSDAFAIASAAGNVLVLSRADVTPFSALKEMSRKLRTTHAWTLGAVIGKF